MVIVINEADEVLELVNPEIVAQQGEQDGWRAACLCPVCGAL